MSDQNDYTWQSRSRIDSLQIETGRYLLPVEYLPNDRRRMRILWAASSEIGYVRKRNEDSLLARPPIFAVADGMGGHEGGKEASETVTRYLAELSTPYKLDPHRIYLQIQEAARAVDALPWQHNRPGTTLSGMGLFFQDDEPLWMVFNIGDSRTYQLENGMFTQLTIDHSTVGQLLASGMITEQEARLSPHRGVITRAIGAGSKTPAQVDNWVRRMKTGQRFLICTDGLHSLLDDAQIMQLMDMRFPVQRAVKNLVIQALSQGGTDNITIVILDVI